MWNKDNNQGTWKLRKTNIDEDEKWDLLGGVSSKSEEIIGIDLAVKGIISSVSDIQLAKTITNLTFFDHQNYLDILW